MKEINLSNFELLLQYEDIEIYADEGAYYIDLVINYAGDLKFRMMKRSEFDELMYLIDNFGGSDNESIEAILDLINLYLTIHAVDMDQFEYMLIDSVEFSLYVNLTDLEWPTVYIKMNDNVRRDPMNYTIFYDLNEWIEIQRLIEIINSRDGNKDDAINMLEEMLCI